VPHRADGSIDPALIAAACDVNRTDSQFALPAVVCLETPQNRCGGIPLTVYLAEIADLGRGSGHPGAFGRRPDLQRRAGAGDDG
jgi:threonine aldolase